MTVDTNKIEERKQGRKLAVDILEMIGFEIPQRSLFPPSLASVDFQEAFWDALRKAFPDQLAKPSPPGLLPMTEEEAIRFEETIVPRGEHGGRRVHRVPMGYWHWWVEHKDPFTEDLRRYVLSDRAKKRTRDEE